MVTFHFISLCIISNFSGPMGPSGDRGATGMQGPRGSTGPFGPLGPDGPLGSTGSTGERGQGGVTGSTGTSGHTGSTGLLLAKSGFAIYYTIHVETIFTQNCRSNIMSYVIYSGLIPMKLIRLCT